MSVATFRNRIISYGVKAADQFLVNDKNARVHPVFQRGVMQAALNEVGFVAPVIETRDGVLLDGHERIWQALQSNSQVPYVVVDIDSSDRDADYVLATFDPITALATYDAQKLDALLADVQSDSPDVQRMLAELAEANGVYEKDDDRISMTNKLGGLMYKIIVSCENETQQLELLERFEQEGLTCQALIS